MSCSLGICSRRAALAWLLAGALTVASALVPGPVLASGAAPAPLGIAATSLIQQGQLLVWRVELTTPFSPGALGRDGRSLCLLLGRAPSGRVEGRVCVSGPARHSRAPRLLYARVSGARVGAAQVIAATVTRSSARELTASFLPTDVGLEYVALRWQVISAVRASACASGCSDLAPASAQLLRLHVPQLVGCVANGPTWVFHGPSDVREIALTFDDGPGYDTPQFLDLLEREHVVATFFQIGDQISEYAQHGLDRRMLSDGDMIGDHTWNHQDVAAGGRFATQEITEAAAAIRRATGGFAPCLFRAPYGAVSPALLSTARSLGFTTVQWDIDPRDWALPGVSAIYDNVITNAHDGAIVEEHDGGGDRSETLAALPMEIHTLRNEGYQFVTVTQMLGYRLLYR